MLAGFLAPNLIVFGFLAGAGALTGYWEQVWRWGFLYAGADPAAQRGVMGLANWLGFQAALVIGVAAWWVTSSKEEARLRLQFAGWIALSLFGVAIGWRFAPRYFLQLLPALVIPAARGVVLFRVKAPLPAYLLLAYRAGRSAIAIRASIRDTGRAKIFAELRMDGRMSRWIRKVERPRDCFPAWPGLAIRFSSGDTGPT